MGPVSPALFGGAPRGGNARADAPRRPAPAFIVGCGRSGTTILGEVLGSHPHVHHLYEPYHLWAAIDPRTDVTGLFGDGATGRYFLDAADADERARIRFRRLIGSRGSRLQRPLEKTPHNLARIGWLEALAGAGRHVHIVRDGLAVSESIARNSADTSFRMAFRSDHNRWWGADGARWRALASEGSQRGCFPDEVGLLESDEARGAYEWVVS